MADEQHDKSRRAILAGGALALAGAWHFKVRDALLEYGAQGSVLKRDGTTLTDWEPKDESEGCGGVLSAGPCSGHSECIGQVGGGLCREAHECVEQICLDFLCQVAQCWNLSGGCNGLDLCSPQMGDCNLITCTAQNGNCNLVNCGPGKAGPCSLTNCPGREGGERVGSDDTPITNARSTPLLGAAGLDEITAMPFARSLQKPG